MTTPLTIDPGGLWSVRQAAAVLAVIGPEAAALGLHFKTVDVTTWGMPAPRVLLVAYCRRHDVPIAPDTACALCLAEARP